MGPIQTIPDFISLLRRRYMTIVTVTIIGAVLAVMFALSMSRRYEASAVVQLETQQIVTNIGGSAVVTNNAALRLQLIEQRLLARDSLKAIIEKHGLFEDTPGLSLAQKIDLMRRAIYVYQIMREEDAWRADAAPSGLSVTVSWGDPQKAADVANELVEGVVKEHQSRRMEQARDALEFFTTQAARTNQKIEALERAVADYRSANSDILLTGITNLSTQMSNMQAAELDLERQILALESDANNQRQSVVQERIQKFREQQVLIRQKIDEISAKIETAPEVEKQYGAMERDLRQLQEQYTDIIKARAEAERSQVLENGQQSERLSILETALPPDYPVSTSRKKLSLFGTGVSLLMGLFVAIALEFMRPALRTAEHLERELGITPVVSIPPIQIKRHMPLPRRRSKIKPA